MEQREQQGLTEPLPIWPDAPRYWPARALPPYRYVAGLNPHPRVHPDGHSFAVPEPRLRMGISDWRHSESYLFGIDLYHQSFFWEAHECWETLWQSSTPALKPFFQGLILNTAAQLKLHQGRIRGAATHSRRSVACIELASSANGPIVCGLNTAEFLDAAKRCYVPLWHGQHQTGGPAPILELLL